MYRDLMVPAIALRGSIGSELVIRTNKAAVYILTMSFRELCPSAEGVSHLLCPVWQKSQSV